ncbi:Protein F32A5.3, partial [Aphelenchoides avenae]
HLLNYDSTDNQNGYPCWNQQAVGGYLNRPEVKPALHVDPAWMNGERKQWTGCNEDLFHAYVPKYTDTFELFREIIGYAPMFQRTLREPFRMLLYNGDLDPVCNYLGDAWHMDNVAMSNGFQAQPRGPWYFRGAVAGWAQRYVSPPPVRNALTIDVLTVKGAGHFAANDRPGPALQMITNFFRGAANYSDAHGINVIPVPAAASGVRRNRLFW